MADMRLPGDPLIDHLRRSLIQDPRRSPERRSQEIPAIRSQGIPNTRSQEIPAMRSQEVPYTRFQEIPWLCSEQRSSEQTPSCPHHMPSLFAPVLQPWGVRGKQTFGKYEILFDLTLKRLYDFMAICRKIRTDAFYIPNFSI